MSKNILLGVTGSVAASKSEILYEILSEEYNVKTICSSGGKRYLSDDFLKNSNVFTSWSDLSGSPHIELARWADKILIYPATANFISKMAMGIADDLLLSTILMHKNPIYIAPAMHEEMYVNKRIQENIDLLAEYNIFCGPRFGNLDIGDKGVGRMIEPDEILQIIKSSKSRVVVTSGGTSEKIDAVRTITNHSSGKQGRAIAIELLAMGHEVVYIHAANTEPISHAKNVTFTTSKSLGIELDKNLEDASHLFMTAAVSDFIPEYKDTKLNRKDGEITINLHPNIDIVKDARKKNPHVTTIAFSAQMDDRLNFQKLNDKNVDFLVINNITKNLVGSNFNKVSIINKDKLLVSTDELSKNDIAKIIIKTTVDT
jgi:phosphopantothenoylcysteine decarboxylase/phosphopantothenate--cysteine ligase